MQTKGLLLHKALVELKSSCSGKTALVEAILKNCEPPDDDTDGDGGSQTLGQDSTQKCVCVFIGMASWVSIALQG
eukprot:518715-Amphidinium_carterae.2